MQATQDDPEFSVRVPVKAGEELIYTAVDVADADRLGALSLSLGSHGYVQMFWKGRVWLLHRWILDLPRGDRRIGDHINGDGLDNRRANLRAVTAKGSSQNISSRGSSGYRGVWKTRSGKWAAYVTVDGVRHRAGLFTDKAEAALAADAMRRQLMPDYAGMRPAGRHQADNRTGQLRVQRAELAARIRQWARDNGIEVCDRGRVPNHVVAAYEAAKHKAEEVCTKP